MTQALPCASSRIITVAPLFQPSRLSRAMVIGS